MKIEEILKKESVISNLAGKNKLEVIKEMTECLKQNNIIKDDYLLYTPKGINYPRLIINNQFVKSNWERLYSDAYFIQKFLLDVFQHEAISFLIRFHGSL